MLPNLDDLAFYNTEDEIFRGGIWDHNIQTSRVPYSPKLSEDKQQSSENEGLENSSTGEHPFMSEPLASRDVEMFTPNVITQLRHRKTLADFRDYASLENNGSDRNLSEDDKILSNSNLASDLKNWEFEKNKASGRKSSFTSNTSSSGGSIHDEPVSMSKTKNTIKNTNFSELKRDTKATITDTMKKWGTWYNKGKRATTEIKGFSKKQSPNSTLTKSPTFTSTSTLDASSVSMGFEPNGLSPTALTSLETFGQNTTDPESTGTTASLQSSKTQRKPVSALHKIPNLHKTGLDSKVNELSKVEYDSEEDEKSHSINPGLTVLRKTTASPKVTVPAQSHTDTHLYQSNPIAIVPKPSEATVAVTPEKVSSSSGSATFTGSCQTTSNPEETFGDIQSDLGIISDVHTIMAPSFIQTSSRPASIRSSAGSIKSSDELAKQLRESIMAADNNLAPRQQVSKAATDGSGLKSNSNSSSSNSIKRVRRKAVGSGPGHELPHINESKAGTSSGNVSDSDLKSNLESIRAIKRTSSVTRVPVSTKPNMYLSDISTIESLVESSTSDNSD